MDTSASTPTAGSFNARQLAFELVLGLLVGDVVDDDLGPLCGQRADHGRADARVATGHDCNLVLQCVCHAYLRAAPTTGAQVLLAR